MRKGEGAITVIFIGIILCVGVTVAGVFVKSNIMIISGASVLGAVAFIASVVFVIRLSKKSKSGKVDAEDSRARRRERAEYESAAPRKSAKSAVVELLKSSIVIGGLLTSCVLFVIFAAIGKFMLGFIVWGCGVGLTVLAFIVLLVRERIASSGMSDWAEQRREERRAQKERQAEKQSFEREYERTEPAQAPEREDRAAESEPSFVEPLKPADASVAKAQSSAVSGKYKFVRATVESCELVARRNDYVDCGGQTFARTYGIYDVRLRSGGEIITASSAVEYRRGSAVYALVGNGNAFIVRGSEIRFGDGKYKMKSGVVKLCIVDVGSMVEKRKRWGDETSSDNWAVDPDHRFIVTVDVDGKRVRAESEIYLNEGTEATFLVGRGGAVRVNNN